ncbi:hypothetical protein Y1Q_0007380 [Alligator mississippiensis]|uniref:Uncharacterized protein n=1 Tax=Alligator mississippiensis TaxID=8496 RepID=A0A151P7S9_ALLMI|nr:hypothetical protein Y1Q_0007380 [Alligator mississippiensis]
MMCPKLVCLEPRSFAGSDLNVISRKLSVSRSQVTALLADEMQVTFGESRALIPELGVISIEKTDEHICLV